MKVAWFGHLFCDSIRLVSSCKRTELEEHSIKPVEVCKTASYIALIRSPRSPIHCSHLVIVMVKYNLGFAIGDSMTIVFNLGLLEGGTIA